MNDVEWRRSVEQRLRELNQKVKPSKRASVGGGGSGSDGIAAFEVDYIADLVGIPRTNRKSFVWVNENNGLYMLNPAKTGWQCLNRFE